MLKTISIISFLVGLAMIAISPVVASVHHEDKVNLCHKTSSETNPFVVQEVNANEVQSHIANGDFLYQGNFSIHSNEAKDWCENNQPGDLCSNIAGKQTEVPTGYEAKDKVCTKVEVPVVPPVATTSATATPSAVSNLTSLPNTGSEVWLLVLGGIGLVSFGWSLKRTLKG